MNSDFENQLQRRPLRELPRQWRSEILAAARPASGPRPLAFVSRLSSWLWPYPRAWAGLAAAWVVIFVLHFTAPDEPRLAGNSSSMTIQSFATLQQQTLMMAQLLGQTDNAEPPAALPAAPKPRSERPMQQMIG